MQYACMIISILGLLVDPFLHPSSVSADADNGLYISAFKVSSTSEYVEIVNDGAVDIDVGGWVIEYSNASGSNIKKVATLSGVMPADTYETYVSSAFVLAYPQDPVLQLRTMEYSGLADSGGYLRLKQPTTDLANYPDGYIKIDEVGWVASATASTNPAIIHYSGTVTLHRCTDALGEYVARGDNRTDFYTSELPTPQTQGVLCADLVVVDPPDEPDDEEIVDPPEELPLTTCAGIVINEILPNPAGADQGNEFIELYNPTDAQVAISGCGIEDSEGNSYTFSTSEIIEPRTWMKLSDTDTGITLVNSKQQTIYLLGQDMSEASSATYPADLEDDQSWALFDDTYASTYTPTPELLNILTVSKPCDTGYVRNTQSGRCMLENSDVDSPLSQCQVGYERNPQTNRCRRVASSSPSACPEGKTRNPQTNRCRGEQTTAVLAACTTGQVRNPETNRCRKIDTQTELIPCAIGQERNPETNRCRSTITTLDTDTSEIGDVVAQKTASALPIGMIAAGSAGYVVYEWRSELVERLRSAWSKLKKK